MRYFGSACTVSMWRSQAVLDHFQDFVRELDQENQPVNVTYSMQDLRVSWGLMDEL